MSTEQERFWNKVDAEGDCWIWLAGVNIRGYGRFSVKGEIIVLTERRERSQVDA